LEPIHIQVGRKEALARCKHEEEWPPVQALLPDSFDELKEQGLIDENTYWKLHTWENVCGLRAMDPVKCAECPHVMVADGNGNLMMPNAPARLQASPSARGRKIKGRHTIRRKSQ